MKKIKRRICECEQQINNIKALPYYTIFNRRAEQQADLKQLEEKLAYYKQKKEAKAASLSLTG